MLVKLETIFHKDRGEHKQIFELTPPSLVTWMSQEVSKLVISPTYKWGSPWGYNPLILTIDPNFLSGTSKWFSASNIVVPGTPETNSQQVCHLFSEANLVSFRECKS